MKKMWIFILFIVTSSLVCGDVIVKFIDGNLEMQKGSVWVELLPGDSISDGSVIRVGENSIVELSDSKTKISLTNPGIYNIDSIVLNRTRSSKAKSLILKIIGRLLGNQPSGSLSSPSTVLGVRAAEVPDDGFSWTNDEYTEYLELGKEYLKLEDYTKAKLSFSDAFDSSFSDFEEDESLFFLSYAESVSGEISAALSLLKDYSPDSDAYYYEQAVLLKANLLIENFDEDKAIMWINAHKAGAVDVAGSLLLLEGLSNLQLGNIDKARKIFRQIIDNNSDLESASVAAEYLDLM